MNAIKDSHKNKESIGSNVASGENSVAFGDPPKGFSIQNASYFKKGGFSKLFLYHGLALKEIECTVNRSCLGLNLLLFCSKPTSADIKQLNSRLPIETIKNEVLALKAAQESLFVIHFLQAFRYQSKVYIVTELYGLSLADLPSQFKMTSDATGTNSFSIPFIMHLVVPVIAAVKHLHSIGIIHRDLKEDNILLSFEGVPKLADFGLAVFKKKLLIGSEKLIKNSADSYVGTVPYIAPEIMLKRDYNEAVDIWALGIMMLSMYYGTNPFTATNLAWDSDEDEADTVEHFFKHEYENLEKLEVNKGQLKFYSLMRLDVGSSLFATLEDWTVFRFSLQEILVINLERRPTAAQLLATEYFCDTMNDWQNLQFTLTNNQDLTAVESKFGIYNVGTKFLAKQSQLQQISKKTKLNKLNKLNNKLK